MKRAANLRVVISREILEKAAIRISLRYLPTFPFAEAAEDEQRFKRFRAYFNIAKGRLAVLNDASQAFGSVA